MIQSIAFDRAAAYYDNIRGFPAGIDKDAAVAIVRAGQLTSTSQT